MDRSVRQVADEWLVLRAQAGSVDAFNLLAKRWHKPVLRHAYGLTQRHDAAADVAQESWVVVAKTLRSLNDPACFRRWLFRIVSRKSVDWIRGRQRDRKLAERVAHESRPETLPDDSNDSDDSTESDVARLREGMQRLSTEQRTLLRMLYQEKMTVAEISEALEIPAGTVKSRLFHARGELKNLLEPVQKGEVR